MRYRVPGATQLNAGINMEKDMNASPEELIARKEASREILFIGRGFHKRGVDILVEAFQLFNARHNKTYRLHLVGVRPGEVEPGDERIRFYGYLNKDKPGDRETYWALLASARLFVFPMRFGPIPGVIREAHWMCTPVILTNIPNGSAEKVAHGWDGILVDSLEAADFSQQMDELVRNRDRWREMARNSRESVRANTWDRTARQFLEAIGDKHNGPS